MSNITEESKKRAAELVELYVPLRTKTDRSKLAKAVAAKLDGQSLRKALAAGEYSNPKMVMALIKCARIEDAENAQKPGVRRSARLRKQKEDR